MNEYEQLIEILRNPFPNIQSQRLREMLAGLKQTSEPNNTQAQDILAAIRRRAQK